MRVSTNEQKINELVTRSVAQIYPSKVSLIKALKSGKRLTFYMGIDPTADYIHLGHSTNYLLLERLHALGHRIIVLVGDFTAMIGDPSDKTSMRQQLTKEEVNENLKSFKKQISSILDFEDKENEIEFKFNSKWLATLTFQDAVELASNFTVQQMIERDAFKKRLSEEKPLYVHEFFYPLMQGYDSVAMDVDGEIGGTDQTFNMLAGRTLLKRYKDKNKYVIATTLLENPVTGEKLMSKSLGTGIALNEAPNDMYIKVMRLPDEGVMQCFIDCTRLSMEEIGGLEKDLKSGSNPKDIKMRLAREVVTMYHGEKKAISAEDNWVTTVSNNNVSADAPKVTFSKNDLLMDILVNIEELNISKSQIRRLFQQGAIRINDDKVDVDSPHTLNDGDILAVGKKHQFILVKK